MNTMERKNGLLYPMLVIAAIGITALSAVGIATMLGWLPPAASSTIGPVPAPQGRIAPPTVDAPRAAGTPAPKPASAPRQVAAAGCSNCGVVESIRPVRVPGEGSWLGAAGGAVVGGLLGNQVGGGRGRTAATVVGAGAGAYAGNEIEKSMTASVRYQVHVRMADGSTRVFNEPAPPAYGVGQAVRVTAQGALVAG